MPDISVIVPTYNCGEFINEAITSILNQTCQASEIIVIDDGSQDNTREIVESIKSTKIRYIRQENAGVSSARNLGIANASGEYIAFLDADDIWHPQMLELQAGALEKQTDAVLCFTNFSRFLHATKKTLPDQFSFYPELNSVHSSVIDGIHTIKENAFCALVDFGEIPAYTQAIIFRKSALSGILFNTKLSICEDLEFFLRVASTGSVAFNPKVLAYVRRHDNNATKDISLIPQHKLKAFLSIQESTPLSRTMLKALNNRIIKSYIDYSTSLILKGSKACAWKNFGATLKIDGSLNRKAKGFLKLLMLSFVAR